MARRVGVRIMTEEPPCKGDCWAPGEKVLAAMFALSTERAGVKGGCWEAREARSGGGGQAGMEKS